MHRRRVAVLTVAALACGSLPGCSTSPASALDVGACYTQGSPEAEGVVKRVETVDCSVEHTSEVVGVVELAEGDFPGRDTLQRRASDECPPLFEDYTGRPYADAEETLNPLLPDTAGWNAGDRRILCVAHTDAPTTGSLAAR